MKGQKLFVRPLDAHDLAEIEALHVAAGEPIAVEIRTATGLVGRLAGSTVAYLTWHRDDGSMVISQLFVAENLRGLRIGRAFLAEAVQIAASGGVGALRVPRDCKLARYFELCGFVSHDDTLSKTIH